MKELFKKQDKEFEELRKNKNRDFSEMPNGDLQQKAYNKGFFQALNKAKPHISKIRQETLQAVREDIENYKGLSSTPEYYIDLIQKLHHNHCVQRDKVAHDTLTQIIWEAKDQALDDLLKSLDI